MANQDNTAVADADTSLLGRPEGTPAADPNKPAEKPVDGGTPNLGADGRPIEGDADAAAAKAKADADADAAKAAEDAKKNAVPDKYEFKPPEGMEIDAALVETVSPVFKELKLTQVQADKLVGIYAARQKAIGEKAASEANAQREAWRSEITKDPAHKENLILAKRAVEKFGDDAFKSLANSTWLGDHPAIVRFLSQVGKLIKEDGMADGKPGGTVKKDPASIMFDHPTSQPKQ